MDLEERKQRLREGIAAFGDGDPGPFTSLLDPGIQWTIIGSSSYSGTSSTAWPSSASGILLGSLRRLTGLCVSPFTT